MLPLRAKTEVLNFYTPVSLLSTLSYDLKVKRRQVGVVGFRAHPRELPFKTVEANLRAFREAVRAFRGAVSVEMRFRGPEILRAERVRLTARKRLYARLMREELPTYEYLTLRPLMREPLRARPVMPFVVFFDSFWSRAGSYMARGMKVSPALVHQPYDWEPSRRERARKLAECIEKARTPGCSRAEKGISCLACAVFVAGQRALGMKASRDYVIDTSTLLMWDGLDSHATFKYRPPQHLPDNHTQATTSTATHQKPTAAQAPHASPAKSPGLNAHRKPTALPLRQ